MASVPISLAVRSKAWVCGRSITGIEVSNPAEGKRFDLFVRRPSKIAKATFIIFVMPVCPSVRLSHLSSVRLSVLIEKLGSHWMHIHET